MPNQRCISSSNGKLQSNMCGSTCACCIMKANHLTCINKHFLLAEGFEQDDILWDQKYFPTADFYGKYFSVMLTFRALYGMKLLTSMKTLFTSKYARLDGFSGNLLAIILTILLSRNLLLILSFDCQTRLLPIILTMLFLDFVYHGFTRHDFLGIYS